MASIFCRLRRMMLAAAISFGCAAAAETPERCRLPRELTVNLPDEVRLPFGELKTLCAAHRRTLTAVPDREKAFLRFELTGDGTPEHPQGYVAEVTANGIFVRSRSAAGLFYGMTAVNDLLRRYDDAGIACVRIVSGKPGFDARAICFSIDRRSAAARDLNRIRRMLKVLAGLRYDQVLLEFGANFPAPGLCPRKKKPLDEKQIRELVAFAEARFIRIVPMLQLWGDCPLLAYRNDKNDLLEPREPGAAALTYCPRHPEVKKLLREMIARQCGILKPEEFFFRIDWNDLAGGIRRCPRCKNAAPEELVAEHLAFLARCAAENGVRPAFILPNFPDDLAAGIPAMLPAGTPVYGLTAGGRAPDAAAAGSPNLTQEIDRSRRNGAKRFIVLEKGVARNCDVAGSLYHTPPAFLGGMVLGATAMWPSPVLACGDPVRHFRMLYSSATPKPRQATPVPIWRQLTAELGATGMFPSFTDAELEELRRRLRNAPERFELPVCFGGRWYGALLARAPDDSALPAQVNIPLGAVKSDAIALMLSCSPPKDPDEFDPARNGRYAFEYGGVAIVVIDYADGTKSRKSLKFRRHISPWNEPFGGYDRHNAAFGSDRRGRFFRFDAVVIENPHPAKPMTGITLRSSGVHGIAPVLLAVSLLDVREGAVPAADPCDELLRLNFQPR